MINRVKAGDQVLANAGSGLANGLYTVSEVYVANGQVRVALVGVPDHVGLGSIVAVEPRYSRRFTEQTTGPAEGPRGHSKDGSSIQKHSLGDIYPLAVVGVSSGKGQTMYYIENLRLGAVAGRSHNRVRQWDNAEGAYRFASRVAAGEKVDYTGDAIIFLTGRPSLSVRNILVMTDTRAIHTKV